MNQIRQFTEAVDCLKTAIKTLFELRSELATAAISVKLIDCLDNIAHNDFMRATEDVWACSYQIYRVLYKSISEKLGKTSPIGLHNNNRDMAMMYIDAVRSITIDTDFEPLFKDKSWIK